MNVNCFRELDRAYTRYLRDRALLLALAVGRQHMFRVRESGKRRQSALSHSPSPPTSTFALRVGWPKKLNKIRRECWFSFHWLTATRNAQIVGSPFRSVSFRSIHFESRVSSSVVNLPRKDNPKVITIVFKSVLKTWKLRPCRVP